MNQKSEISYSAFIEELGVWQLTLRRELNRLVFLKNQLPQDKLINKKLINQIEILQTEIESELLKYRKEKQRKNIDFEYIISKYNNFSKKFIQLVESINKIHEHSLQNSQSSVIMKSSNDDYHKTYQQKPNQSKQNIDKSMKRGYLDQTFTVKMAKNHSKNKSFEKNDRLKVSKYAQNASWLSNLMKQVDDKKGSLQPKVNKQYHSKQKALVQKQNNQIKSKHSVKDVKHIESSSEDYQNIQLIKYQLNELKTSILQTHKKIDSHQHEQYDKDINKLKHNNKKILLDIKIIKQQNTSFLHQIYQIKKQIQEQKKLQINMIKSFQRPRKIEMEKQLEYPQDVADWVKQRIQKL